NQSKWKKNLFPRTGKSFSTPPECNHGVWPKSGGSNQKTSGMIYAAPLTAFAICHLPCEANPMHLTHTPLCHFAILPFAIQAIPGTRMKLSGGGSNNNCGLEF